MLLENDILEGEGGPYSLPYPVFYLKGLQIGPHLGAWFCGHEVYCPRLLGMNRVYFVVLIHISLYTQFQKLFRFSLQTLIAPTRVICSFLGLLTHMFPSWLIMVPLTLETASLGSCSEAAPSLELLPGTTWGLLGPGTLSLPLEALAPAQWC